jgi:hypothetical protein
MLASAPSSSSPEGAGGGGGGSIVLVKKSKKRVMDRERYVDATQRCVRSFFPTRFFPPRDDGCDTIGES